MRLVFVCTGAINRSPASAVIAAQILGLETTAAAARPGQRGRPMTRRMVAALAAAGYAVPDPVPRSRHVSDGVWTRGEDRFLYAQPSHALALAEHLGDWGSDGPLPLASFSAPPLVKIPDPHFDRSRSACPDAVRLIEQCVLGLALSGALKDPGVWARMVKGLSR